MSDFDLSKITGTEPPVPTEFDLVEGHLHQEIERLRQVIVRLREEYSELDALRHSACDQRDAYKAEVERLRKQLGGQNE
jgi:hypothetical protein